MTGMDMTPPRPLDSLAPGEAFVSDWIAVAQARINAFAEVTEDWQPIHTDPEAAARSAFGGTIGHGFLTLALLSRMLETALPRLSGVAEQVNYGFDRIRFLAPVPSGSRIRARFALEAATPRGPGQVLLRLGVTIETEAGQAVLAATWLALMMRDGT